MPRLTPSSGLPGLLVIGGRLSCCRGGVVACMATRSARNNSVEVLDLIVDADGHGRRPVRRDVALRGCDRAHDRWAARLVSSIPSRQRLIPSVDRLLIEVHREIDRLSKPRSTGLGSERCCGRRSSRCGNRATHRPTVVDHGCGTGYLIRWLAEHGTLMM